MQTELDPDDHQTREVYAHYGLAMYLAQTVERGLSMVLALAGTSDGATTWDLDASLAEYYALTFGDLVTRFTATHSADHPNLASRLRRANQDRNLLAHQYFWDRAVSFNSPDGRQNMLAELQQMQADLAAIDHELVALYEHKIVAHGDTPEALGLRTLTVMNGYLHGTLTPSDPKRVPTKVEVVAAQVWRSEKQLGGNMVFVTGEGRHLVPGEKGLVYGPTEIPDGHLVERVDFPEAFPVEINPRPKTSVSWNYGIPLANGYILRTKTNVSSEPGVFYVWIQGPKPSG